MYGVVVWALLVFWMSWFAMVTMAVMLALRTRAEWSSSRSGSPSPFRWLEAAFLVYVTLALLALAGMVVTYALSGP